MRLPSLPALAPHVDLPLWPPILATRGKGSRSALHAHHAIHVLLAFEGEIRVRTRATARWTYASGVLSGPDVLHAIDAEGIEWTRRAIATLGGTPVAARRLVHPRVRKLLQILRTMPANGDNSLNALASAVGLSPGRLMHAFTTSIGVPIRPYLAWLKLQRAASAIPPGTPLSQAAH